MQPFGAKRWRGREPRRAPLPFSLGACRSLLRVEATATEGVATFSLVLAPTRRRSLPCCSQFRAQRSRGFQLKQRQEDELRRMQGELRCAGGLY